MSDRPIPSKDWDKYTDYDGSVDSETEEAVKKVVEAEFRQHTVISIAHRLDTVMGYDRVVVLDKGKVAEVGHPQQLLESGGKFRDLWEASHSAAE